MKTGHEMKKLKMKKYQFESEALRPYFKSENVISGIFEVAKKLYGLSFEKLDNIDVWHKEVQTFEVTDDKNKHVGLLYIDLYPRQSKKASGCVCLQFNSVNYRKTIIAYLF